MSEVELTREGGAPASSASSVASSTAAAPAPHLEALVLAARERDVPDGVVRMAAELLSLEPGLDDDERLALVLLLVSLLVSERAGSTRLPIVGDAARGALVGLFRELGKGVLDAARADSLVRSVTALVTSGRLARLVGRTPGERRPLVWSGAFLATHRLFTHEERVAARVARLWGGATDEARLAAGRRALADVVRAPPSPGGAPRALSREQEAAVLSLARRRLSVVSGGPGTGKTSIVVAMLRVAVRLGVSPERIALAAPTGKAAFRMGESVQGSLATVATPTFEDRTLERALAEGALSPRTLHRLLQYSRQSGRFGRHENHPLEAELVIVDESSMLDLLLLDALTAALRDDARLVLLGDAEQLPSVEVGAALAELVSLARAPFAEGAVSVLTKSFRMREDDPDGRAVLGFARAVARGEVDKLDARRGSTLFTVRSHASELSLRGVELLSTPEREPGARGLELEALSRSLARHAAVSPGAKKALRGVDVVPSGTSLGGYVVTPRGLPALAEVAAVHAAVRVLGLTKSGPAGTRALSTELHRLALASGPVLGGARFEGGALALGEPVLVTVNDYERALWNGDQGIVVRARPPVGAPFAAVAFARGEGFVAYPLADLEGQLELAHTLTVHKAQGSEVDVVVLVLPPGDAPLLTREVVYTAVTRARRGAVLVGSPALLALAAGRRDERRSGLAERIRALST